MFNFTAIEGG